MREKLLKKLADWHTYYPWRMLLVCVLITIIMGGLAGQLKLSMQTSDLLPEGDSKVVQFNKIVDEFATASNLTVVVQGNEGRIKEFADEIAPHILELRDTSQNESNKEEIDNIQKRIEELRSKGDNESEITELEAEIQTLQSRINIKLFQRVDYKAEIDFLRNHMLMLIKEDDLKNTKDVFLDPNLAGLLTNYNNSMEKEYVGQEESISTREKEDGAVNFLGGIQNLVQSLKNAVGGNDVLRREVEEAADKLLFGEPYMLSSA
ncbi:hypothetical protein ACFL4T_14055 [candidate division KSB1 bacterium]